ncbi:hypothetical protein BJD12_13445 [Xanthomonas vesicatoria ATCC 35937]|uniref:Uncharacterized protein n=1 Tax=Xanthomonas vesicatoria ATCC 35937 TaxID=925775 RepID=F0BC58_9XANT|nr:hypothetical protein [Xanthomonas vesicatoria]APP76066.1 hypothetical protein BJD12_13445 [Xanthomonas vesicatoria ATCC 35937]EGD10041.1 hypothetical protein XVE_1683 [Xanthomonas vesicatoria ATCC 35937]KTF35330.1 hypothetical protein LMG920_03080 [Xanthomonas vesicatoria]
MSWLAWRGWRIDEQAWPEPARRYANVNRYRLRGKHDMAELDWLRGGDLRAASGHRASQVDQID